MAFSDAAIGFFLQMEDEMTPQLPGAAKAYEKFINTLTKLNQKGFAGTQGFLGSMGALVKSVEKMTGGSEAKLNVGLSKKSEKGLGDVVGKAVMQALSKVKLRLTASLPKQKMKMFSQDAALRTLYRDMPQPPDMAGKFDIPQFAKGGKVPGTGSKDSVLGLLTPGEEIIPTELVGKIEKALDGLEKSQKAIGAGFGNKKDLEEYNKGLRETAEAMDMLTEATQEAGFETAQRLAPQITQMQGRFEDMGKTVEKKVAPSFKTFFEKVLGPVRFIAVKQGLDAIQKGFVALRSSASSAFSTAGGEAIGSAIDNLNEMNQFLGLSRDALGDFKVEVGILAKELDGVTVDELAFSIKTLAELGVKAPEQLKALGTSAALIAKGTDVAAESAGKFAFQFTGAFGKSQETLDDFFGSLSRLSDANSGFNISAGKLFEQTQKDIESLGTSLKDLSDKEAQNLLASFNRIGASLETNFVGADKIREVLAGAFEGGEKNIKNIQLAFQLTGKSQKELQAALKSGDIDGIFERIADTLSGKSTAALATFAERMNLSSNELKQLVSESDALTGALRKSGELLPRTGEGLAIITERAQNNKTAFQDMQEAVTDGAAGFSMFGITGLEVMDFLKEFNLTALLAGGALVTNLIPGIAGAAASLFGLNGIGLTSTITFKALGKGLLTTLGPLALVAAAGAAAAFWINKLGNEIEQVRKDREEDQAFVNKNADQGRQIMSAKKQLAQLEASGKLAATRRGKGETSFLSGSQEKLKVQLQQQLLDANVEARKRAGRGPSADEIAKLQVQIAEGKGQGDVKMQKKADDQTELLKQIAASLKNQENEAQPPNLIQGVAQGVGVMAAGIGAGNQ